MVEHKLCCCRLCSTDAIESSYGDMELFLAGIELSALVPLFKQHGVSFPMFLRLTDSDLQKVDLDFAMAL